MSRSLTTQLNTDVAADHIAPFLAFDFEFDSGTIYLWNGVGEKTIDGKLYIGAGALLSVSEIEETSQLDARGVTLVLTSLDFSLLSIALAEPYQGRPAKVYLGVATDYSEMTEIFSGYMDKMDIDEGLESCAIRMSIENKLIELERIRSHRYTSAYQKDEYPGDKAFDFVEDLLDKKLPWGRAVDEKPSKIVTGTGILPSLN